MSSPDDGEPGLRYDLTLQSEEFARHFAGRLETGKRHQRSGLPEASHMPLEMRGNFVARFGRGYL
jgi:hypothetical protein